jgi:hypothetical protein
MTRQEQQIIIEPPARHVCAPPEYRPKSEWRSMPAPPGWTKGNPGVKLTVPTPYPPGTVWVCRCGQGWVFLAGRHYGRNPNIGYTPGWWTHVSWWQRKIKKAIAARRAELAYQTAAGIVESFVLKEGP